MFKKLKNWLIRISEIIIPCANCWVCPWACWRKIPHHQRTLKTALIDHALILAIVIALAGLVALAVTAMGTQAWEIFGKR